MRIWMAVFSFLGMGLLSFLFRHSYQPGMVGDDASFYLGAVSLARNGKYLDLSDPEKPLQRHHTPGYPLLLAASFKFFPESISTARALNLLLAGLSLAWMAWMGVMLLGPGWAAIACGWMMLHPITSFLSAALLSEIPYLLISLIALQRISRSDPGRIQTTLPIGFLLVSLFWIRPIGISLLLAYGLWTALRREFRQTWGAGILSLALVASYLLWSHAGKDSQPYSKELLHYMTRLASPLDWADALFKKGTYYLGRELAGFFVPWNLLSSWGSLGKSLGILWALLPLGGLTMAFRQPLQGPWGLLLFYAGFYMGALMIWPTASGRYLFPLLPIFICLILSGWKWICSRAPGRAYVFAVWATLTFLLNLGGLWSLGRGQLRNLPQRIPRETFDWIRSSADPLGVFAAETAAPLTLHTDRSCVELEYLAHPDLLMDELFRKGVRYLFLRKDEEVMMSMGGRWARVQKAMRFRTLALLINSPLWKVIYQNPGEETFIFELAESPAAFRRAYEIYKQGETAFRMGGKDHARKFFQQALSLDARLCDARIYLASYEMESKNASRALSLLKEAARLWPNYPLARSNYAKALGANRRFEEARKELTALLELSHPTLAIESDQLAHRQAQTLLNILGR